MGWAGYVDGMGVEEKCIQVLMGRTEGKRPNGMR